MFIDLIVNDILRSYFKRVEINIELKNKDLKVRQRNRLWKELKYFNDMILHWSQRVKYRHYQFGNFNSFRYFNK